MNRRQLLQLTLAALASTSYHQSFANQLQAGSNTGKRLVLVELAGANDGMNTLVPYSNNYYRSLRPTIALPRPQTIALTDDYALHNALQPLMRLWDRGQMAWIHGLGYPNPNRSHFKSIALWETGGDGNKQRRSGWLTHDIEHKLKRRVNDAHGISFAEDMNLFSSDGGRWLSMTSPEQFDTVRSTASANITVANESIAMVAQRITELEQSLHGISSKLEQAGGTTAIPGGEFGYQLQQVVRLIRAGLDTPVYRVRLDGFDTHEYQLYRHSGLLSQLANGLDGFQKALESDGEWHNTLVVTYSEFGRRVWENKSQGTDHGTAAPHFVIGGNINGGLYGNAPPLDALKPGQDPDFTTDYRALYGEILNSWFDIKKNSFSEYHHSALDNIIQQSS